MPIHSVFRKISKNPNFIADKQNFLKQMKNRKIPILYFNFAYSDTDFPDIYHLRASLSESFTSALAESYVETNNTLLRNADIKRTNMSEPSTVK
jgi:hypothetical protein